ncbi:hypothetical protein KR018_006943 [Drosophila ironensis]|nr:hypothetical protein KR018_006943 [Drosophila ironensis]
MRSSGVMRLLQLLGLLLLLSGGVQGVYCPAGCNCLERTVRCIRAKLSAVPQVPQDTQVLDLRFNHIEELPANAFSGLSQLTTLFLNDNELAYLQDGALNGLSALRFLYLNNNRLSRLPATIFQRLPRLEAVFLENNDIWQLPAGVFDKLPRLNRLMLFNNKLTQLPVDAFNRLNNLKRLRLDGNAIDCNCGLYSMWRRWHLDVQRQLVAITLTCASPQVLQHQSFASLSDQHFKCVKPQFLVAPQDTQAFSGEQVELSCEVTGLPPPKITWMHNTNELDEEQTRSEVLPSGSLLIRSADAIDMGIYQCIARNEMGELHSQPIRLVVSSGGSNVPGPESEADNLLVPDARSNQVWADPGVPAPPHFTHQPHDQIVDLHNPGHVLLDCAASGSPQPDIQWFVNGRQLTQSRPNLQLQANGSLVLVQPNQLSAGTYRCEAHNSLGSVQATARIEVKELPEILLPPQNQTIKLGKAFVLECDADGNPLPTIDWQFNGQPLLPGARSDLQLENENTELVVNAARQEHAGVYRCTARNENGERSAEAIVKVERLEAPPRVAIEPSNLVAITGTTIELPCQAEQPEDGLQISWRRDGRLIDPNVQLAEKYQISGAGSLFVKNVTILDGGRYECQLRNQFGRTSASALVTVRRHQQQQAAGNRQQAAGNRQQASGNRQPATAICAALKLLQLQLQEAHDVAEIGDRIVANSPLGCQSVLRINRQQRAAAAVAVAFAVAVELLWALELLLQPNVTAI